MCKYSLEFPSVAAEYDRLIIRVKEVKNAQIYAVQTFAFSSSSYAETIIDVDDAIIVSYPYSVYITIVSDPNPPFGNPASFAFSFWFEDRDPETLTDEEKGITQA